MLTNCPQCGRPVCSDCGSHVGALGAPSLTKAAMIAYGTPSQAKTAIQPTSKAQPVKMFAPTGASLGAGQLLTWDSPYSSNANYAQHFAGVVRLQWAKWGVAHTDVLAELERLAGWIRYVFATPVAMFAFVRSHARPPATSRNLTDSTLTFDPPDQAPSKPNEPLTGAVGWAVGGLLINSLVLGGNDTPLPIKPSRDGNLYATPIIPLMSGDVMVWCWFPIEGAHAIECWPYNGPWRSVTGQ